jgi:hypothetical protein
MVPSNRIRGFWRNFSESNPPFDSARCRIILPSAAPPWMPDPARIHAVLQQRISTPRRPPRGLLSRIWRFVRQTPRRSRVTPCKSMAAPILAAGNGKECS